MGKRLKAKIEQVEGNIERLYNNLGNIAFWDAAAKTAAAPTQLDWGNPKHTVTVYLSLTNAIVKHNGESVTNGQTFQVEEGSSLTLSVEAETGNVLDSVTAPGATVAGDLSTVTIDMNTSNITLNITAQASGAYSISYNLSNCAAPTGVTNPTAIRSGETKTIYLQAAVGYTMPSSLPSGAVIGTVSASYSRDGNDDTKATITLSGASSDVSIAVSASASVAGTTVNVKKITGVPTVQSDGTVDVADYSMTEVDDSTIQCSVGSNGQISIPSGYGVFSAQLLMGSTDISDCIDFETLTINVANITDALTLNLVLADATDGMFLGKSFHGSEGTDQHGPGNLVIGPTPTPPSGENDAWCCMSEFVKLPTGANKVRIVYGAIFNGSDSTSNQIQNKRGNYIYYNDKGQYTGRATIYQKNTTQRETDIPSGSNITAGTPVYIRASFIQNKVASTPCAIYFSTDGGSTWESTPSWSGANKELYPQSNS